MNGTQAKVCLFVAILKFKVALLDRVTQTVQTRLRSDRDYNTTIGSIRGLVELGCVSCKVQAPWAPSGTNHNGRIGNLS